MSDVLKPDFVYASLSSFGKLRHLWQYTYITFGGEMVISVEELPLSYGFHEAIDFLSRLIPDDASLISVALQEVDDE